MKKIKNKDAQRILNCLTKAKSVIDKTEDGNDSDLYMDEDIAKECFSALSAILFVLTNSVQNT